MTEKLKNTPPDQRGPSTIVLTLSMIGTLLWLGGGVIAFGVGVWLCIYAQNTANSALKTTGTVIENTRCLGNGNVGEYSTIQFAAADGLTYTFRSGCNSPHQIGENVLVLYDAQNPQDAETDHDHFFAAPLTLGVILVGLISIIKAVYQLQATWLKQKGHNDVFHQSKNIQ